ncbi:MAG: hypothetical protein ABL904_02720 [Hyphomicrobiaceae bacterium]
MQDDQDKSDQQKARGGHARAEAMTPEQRTESARKAALARWAKVEEDAEDVSGSDDTIEIIPPGITLPIARWRGAMNIVGLEVPCYVLDNGEKIIGRTSATELLTGIKGGGSPREIHRR